MTLIISEIRDDTAAELELVRQLSLANGAFDAVVANHWAKGGAGATDLAASIVRACQQPSNFRFLYDLGMPLDEKIRTIAREIYGADDIKLSELAEERIALYKKQGFNDLPICMSKTHLSLTADPNIKGAPKGFVIPIRDVTASIGAGFIIPRVGTVSENYFILF